jgi:tetratricopeptide (TPR) repeat protein
MTSRRRVVLAGVAAFVVFVAAYSNSFQNAFSFDDIHVVQQNLFIRDLANIPRFFADARTFSSLPQNATYRPLVSTTLAIDFAIAHGLSPVTYHVTQLVLFALVGLCSAVLMRRLFATAEGGSAPTWIALIAATLYGVHTANTQVGNYITARSESLAALGVLTAFLIYLLGGGWRRYHVYLIPVIVGAMAKNHAIVFAPLLLCWKLLIEEQLSISEILTGRRWEQVRTAMSETLPAFALAAVLFLFVEGMSPPEQTYGGGARGPYFATQTWMWVRYARMYFLPTGLSADTDIRPFTSFMNWRVLAGLAFLELSLYAAARASRSRQYRPVAFGILWFWIAIAPTSSIFPLAEVTNDHRAFLGYIGLTLAVVWFLWSVGKQHRFALATAAVAVIGALSIGTWQRNKVWRTDETLWADVAKKSPNNGRGLMNYGLSQMSRGRYGEAYNLFKRAAVLLPNYSFLEVNLGVVTNAMQNPLEADRHFQRALSLDEKQPVAHRLYARFLLDHARGPEAIVHLKRALTLSPGELESRHMLMAIYAARGMDQELRSLADETLGMTSNDPDARAYSRGLAPNSPVHDDYGGWFNLGFAFTRSNRHLDAAPMYRVAIARDSTKEEAWNNLGWTLGRMGFFEEAEPALRRALALKPTFALARNNLAWLAAQRPKR